MGLIYHIDWLFDHWERPWRKPQTSKRLINRLLGMWEWPDSQLPIIPVYQDMRPDADSSESNFAQPTEEITEQPTYYRGPENQLLRDPDNVQGVKKLRF
jgi:hypothetical protein